MDRYYASFGLMIQESTIETLLLWNTSDEYKDNEHYDSLFIELLLIDIFGTNGVTSEMDENKLKFAQNVFKHRVNDVFNRYSKFSSYVSKMIEKFEKNSSTTVGNRNDINIVQEQSGTQSSNEFEEGFISGTTPMPLPINMKCEDAISGKIPFMPRVFIS